MLKAWWQWAKKKNSTLRHLLTTRVIEIVKKLLLTALSNLYPLVLRSCLKRADHSNGKLRLLRKVNAGIQIEAEIEIKVGIVLADIVHDLILILGLGLAPALGPEGRGQDPGLIMVGINVEGGLLQGVVVVIDAVIEIVIDVIDLGVAVGVEVDHLALLVVTRQDALEDLIEKIAPMARIKMKI